MAEQYNSNFTGPEIDAILGNAVRYDLAQSFSSAQQAQARDNINAAPDGYGLGNAPTDVTSLASITKNGFYSIHGGDAPDGGYWQGVHLGGAAKYGALQIMESQTNAKGCACLRYTWAGEWTPWEWVNPPLALGVEYRTTERYLGKPVYCKLVNCGEIAGDKTVAHGISSMSRCIFAQGNYLGAILPMIVNRSLSDTRTVYISSVSNTAITIICGANITGGTCYVQVNYTKPTD